MLLLGEVNVLAIKRCTQLLCDHRERLYFEHSTTNKCFDWRDLAHRKCQSSLECKGPWCTGCVDRALNLLSLAIRVNY